MEYVIAGCAYFVFVFFKAFQQRNVVLLHYKLVMPISYMMAGTEVIVYAVITLSVVEHGGLSWDLLWYVFAVGTGGGLGAIAGMFLHEKHVAQKRQSRPEPGGEEVKFVGAEECEETHLAAALGNRPCKTCGEDVWVSKEEV